MSSPATIILNFIHPDDLDRSQRAELGRLVGGQAMQGFENRFRAKDGGYRVIAWAGVPEAGRIHSIGRDMTGERALPGASASGAGRSRRSSRLSRLSRTLAVNPAWTRVLGWSEAESIGRHVNEVPGARGAGPGAPRPGAARPGAHHGGLRDDVRDQIRRAPPHQLDHDAGGRHSLRLRPGRDGRAPGRCGAGRQSGRARPHLEHDERSDGRGRAGRLHEILQSGLEPIAWL